MFLFGLYGIGYPEAAQALAGLLAETDAAKVAAAARQLREGPY